MLIDFGANINVGSVWKKEIGMVKMLSRLKKIYWVKQNVHEKIRMIYFFNNLSYLKNLSVSLYFRNKRYIKHLDLKLFGKWSRLFFPFNQCTQKKTLNIHDFFTNCSSSLDYIINLFVYLYTSVSIKDCTHKCCHWTKQWFKPVNLKIMVSFL